MNQDYSDEMLNAYLDDELDAEEKKHLLNELRTDKLLRQRVCQLEQVRNMVAIAYHDVADEKQVTQTTPRRYNKVAAIAAGLFVALGTAIGWYAHDEMSTEPSLLELAKQVQQVPPVANEATWRVLMHVTSNDPYRLNALLDETESLLNEYKATNRKVSIQILANGKGLDMLRNDTSPYAKRIHDLQTKYDNIVFTACAKALARLEQERAENVTLLPNTKIAPSALQEVLTKQREGWTYIKI
jgi:intracellular sulfur oxidation DsrE/DsrF family protein